MRSAPHLEVFEKPRPGETLCCLEEGDSLDGFWRRSPGPRWTGVPHRSVPIVPRVLFSQALGLLPGREDQRTPLCCSMTRCDGGCENPGRRSGCIAEGMPRPPVRPPPPHGGCGFLGTPPSSVLFFPSPYSLGAAGTPSWKSKRGGRDSEDARGHQGPE